MEALDHEALAVTPAAEALGWNKVVGSRTCWKRAQPHYWDPEVGSRGVASGVVHRALSWAMLGPVIPHGPVSHFTHPRVFPYILSHASRLLSCEPYNPTQIHEHFHNHFPQKQIN